MQDRLNFIREFNRVWAQLVEILEIDTGKSSDQDLMERRICERFDVIQSMAMKNDDRASFRLARLAILLDNLQRIKENRPQLFEDFKSGFHTLEHNRYFGWRCEVDTAAFLVKHDIEFTHPDPPDFKLVGYTPPISIECTSTHIRGSNRTAQEKITDKVSDKSDKDYYNPSTALFIDITNIVWKAQKRGEEISSTNLKSWVQDRIDLLDLDIGSVLLLGYYADWNTHQLEHLTDRVDNSPSEELLEFLAEYFPFGQSSSKLRWIPPEP